ncbi:dihydrofolate reductase family protein [Streptomyces sp. AC495_CC817]|uniref:dihydrofolate reductase family protein n=1 Tax=Streptomyces sp. AC495_CC817 TaxID=2823900 RepID=UPI001C26BA29|nr:dihydrofolate reductase family protein [Streptomyces sp. AC495_CC817]
MRELVYYVAVTLDGFIAGPSGEFDAFLTEGDHMEAINERFADTVPTDYATMLGLRQDRSMFDTVLMGWNTYAVGGVPSPYRHLRQIVFSRSRTADAENLEVTAERPIDVVRRLKGEEGAAIWLCGGGRLAGELAPEIDRLVVKRYPLLFGDGIPMFAPTAYAPSRFEEQSTTTFGSGVVFSEYVRRAAG